MFKKIITVLILILSILVFICVYLIITPDKNETVINSIENAVEEIKTIKDETIIEELNLINSINCLEGTVGTRITFSNEEITEDDINFQWLKEKFSKITSKEITIDSKIRFVFAYDLKDMPVENNVVYISENRLEILSIELLNNESIYSDRVGFLEKKFSPQELNSLNQRVKQYAYNSIQSKTELREKSLENVKRNLEELIPDIKVILDDVNVLENNDIYIKDFEIN